MRAGKLKLQITLPVVFASLSTRQWDFFVVRGVLAAILFHDRGVEPVATLSDLFLIRAVSENVRCISWSPVEIASLGMETFRCSLHFGPVQADRYVFALEAFNKLFEVGRNPAAVGKKVDSSAEHTTANSERLVEHVVKGGLLVCVCAAVDLHDLNARPGENESFRVYELVVASS